MVECGDYRVYLKRREAYEHRHLLQYKSEDMQQGYRMADYAVKLGIKQLNMKVTGGWETI